MLHMEHDVICFARTQHGVIGRHQAFALGLSDRQLERRLQSERLVYLARGVYALRSSQPSWDRLVMAAWVVSLERRYAAALGMTTAAALYGLAGLTRGGTPELVAPGGERHTNPFGTVMRRRDLEPGDVIRRHDGVAVTTPVRTVLDLAMADARPGRAERIIDGATASGLVVIDELRHRFAAMAALGKPGTVHVRRILHEGAPV